MVWATAWISSTITASVVGEDLAHVRGEHQVERLRRGDEDVRAAFWPSPGALSGRCRRCAGRPRCRRRSRAAAPAGCARCRRRAPSAARRRRAARRYPAAARAGQLVDPPEEAGQGLAGAGRGADQRVVAAGDRLPAPRLRRRRPLEGGLEPAPHRRAERRQRIRLRAFFAAANPSILRSARGSSPNARRELDGLRAKTLRLPASAAGLRGSAGELHVGEPGLLRHEALGEEAGAVAEVAGARLVVDREPVDPLQLPFRLLGARAG